MGTINCGSIIMKPKDVQKGRLATKRRVSIRNSTHYESRDIEALVRGAMNAEAPRGTRAEVHVEYEKWNRTRRWRHSVKRRPRTIIAGDAEIITPNDRRVRCLSIWLPKGTKSDPITALPEEVVKALAMKLCSLLGGVDQEWWTCDGEWANDYVIRGKIPKKLTRQEKSEKAEKHARAMLARAEEELARVKVRVAKWTRKVRYYDRRAAAGE